MNKKVLIITEGWAGSGHRMAAVALQQVLQEQAETEVVLLEGLMNVNPLLRELSRISYLQTIQHFPRGWEFLYQRGQLWHSLLKKPLGKYLGKRMHDRVIRLERPDVVVLTHAYCLAALAETKRQLAQPFQLVVVVTDFHVNPFWIHEQVDRYVVPHESIGEELSIRHGISKHHIHTYGIPLRPAFAHEAQVSKREWKQRVGLDPDRFTVLISGGEGGYGAIRKIVRCLAAHDRSLQLVVITGKNKQLYRELQQESKLDNLPLLLLGYVEKMWQWIGAADVYISKPGGITCAEALALGTPLIFYQPLPGQEQKNCQFFLEQRWAVHAASEQHILQIIRRWQAEPSLRLNLSEQMRLAARPDAAYRTAEMIGQLATRNWHCEA
ncbi:MGDG synthase family glycosyltransferase [Brevibacillus fulvus]|uniref:Processive 1,2-diacylglycerol beta-glucosyltransferase n=1 Tax=Brevibacillus fulvus TaxID=1125967 RepID=A0A938XV26_9BACL|nr:glycosyltransferase [Brevibacillus fulvus]MBM7591008.1 processive 1,2-diacylglycerol beta-glucosyltransferase [Brevibacillus fulvus]